MARLCYRPNQRCTFGTAHIVPQVHRGTITSVMTF